MTLIRARDCGLRLRRGPGAAPLEVTRLPGLEAEAYAASLSDGKLGFFTTQGKARTLPNSIPRADYFVALRGRGPPLCAYAQGRDLVLARLSLEEGGAGLKIQECSRISFEHRVTALAASQDGSMVAVGAEYLLFSVGVERGADSPRFLKKRAYSYFSKDVRVLEFDPYAPERGPVIVALDSEGSMGVFDTSAEGDDECLFMSSFLFPVSAVLAAKEGYWLLVGLAGLALAGREDGEVLWKKLDVLEEAGKADLLLPPLSRGGAVYAVSGFLSGNLRLSKLVHAKKASSSSGEAGVRLEHAYTLVAPDFASQQPPPETAASRQRSKRAPAPAESLDTPHAPCCAAWDDEGLVALTDSGEVVVYRMQAGDP